MKDYQEAEIKMMQEIVSFFDENPEFEKNNAILKTHVDKLRGILKEIGVYAIKQNYDNTGYTENKKKAKDELAHSDLNITASICSYATDSGKNELYNEFKTPISKVLSMSDAGIVNYTNTILLKADEYKKDLEPYNVTADELVNLTKQKEAYSALLLIPAEERKEKTVATHKIKALITEGLQMLKRSVDHDMVHYKDTEPDLYEKYEALREIDDSKTMHMSLIGHVEDADSDCDGTEDGCALEFVKVTVKFKAGSELADSVKSTSKKGNYQFDKLPDGKCTVTFEKNYYDTLVINSEIHDNHLTRLDAKLKKSVETQK